MNEISKMLTARSNYLHGVLSVIESKYADLPRRVLYRLKRRGNIYYYYKDRDSRQNPSYIKKENISLLQELAQREYIDKLQEAASSELAAIDGCLAQLPPKCAEEVYDTAEEDVKSLIDPVVDSDERFAARWERDHYTERTNISLPEGIETERGEWVRSKSECLIANMLNKNAIPYVYEKPLKIGDFLFHPDFTILDVRGRCEIFYEHFGMMGDAEYANNAVNKLNIYNRAGYNTGDRLLVSMETSDRPLDIRAAEKMVLRRLGISC